MSNPYEDAQLPFMNALLGHLFGDPEATEYLKSVGHLTEEEE